MYNPVPVSRDFVGTSGTWEEVLYICSLFLSISLVVLSFLRLCYMYVKYF